MVEQRIDRASWLGNHVLLVVGRLGNGHEGQIAATAISEDREEMELSAWTLSLDGLAGPDRAPKQLLVTRFPIKGDRATLERIELGTGADLRSLDFREIERAGSELQSVVVEELTDRDPQVRRSALASIVHAAGPSVLEPEGMSVAEQLRFVNEALRPRLRTSETKPEEPAAVGIDALLACNERSLVIRGWAYDAEHSMIRLTAISPEGESVELSERLFRLDAPVLEELFAGSEVAHEQPGFVCFVELETPSLLPRTWMVELVTPDYAIETHAPDVPNVTRDIDAVRDYLLLLLEQESAGDHELSENHLRPASDRLQNALSARLRFDSVFEFGSEPDPVQVSIVVPLYERADLLEWQLAVFAQDPEVRGSDLIYVLDSPELADEVVAAGHRLHSLYDVPFRLAVLNRNGGVANARNMGASLARGRLLLFLDSDVMPDRPGWLGRLVAFHDATRDIGALGPKLLYEDDSIQHAGIDLELDPVSQTWENVHRFKGLHRRLEAAEVNRPVVAVTGACLMIGYPLFHELGGFSNSFVRGGCEDSDLCLRLFEKRRQNWYLPEVELYHLEAQSFPFSEQRALVTQYNTWLQTRLRAGRLQARGISAA